MDVPIGTSGDFPLPPLIYQRVIDKTSQTQRIFHRQNEAPRPLFDLLALKRTLRNGRFGINRIIFHGKDHLPTTNYYRFLDVFLKPTSMNIMQGWCAALRRQKKICMEEGDTTCSHIL